MIILPCSSKSPERGLGAPSGISEVVTCVRDVSEVVEKETGVSDVEGFERVLSLVRLILFLVWAASSWTLLISS